MSLPTKWLTEDGRLIQIKYMATSHIKTAVDMLERLGHCRVNNNGDLDGPADPCLDEFDEVLAAREKRAGTFKLIAGNKNYIER